MSEREASMSVANAKCDGLGKEMDMMRSTNTGLNAQVTALGKALDKMKSYMDSNGRQMARHGYLFFFLFRLQFGPFPAPSLALYTALHPPGATRFVSAHVDRVLHPMLCPMLCPMRVFRSAGNKGSPAKAPASGKKSSGGVLSRFTLRKGRATSVGVAFPRSVATAAHTCIKSGITFGVLPCLSLGR